MKGDGRRQCCQVGDRQMWQATEQAVDSTKRAGRARRGGRGEDSGDDIVELAVGRVKDRLCSPERNVIINLWGFCRVFYGTIT